MPAVDEDLERIREAYLQCRADHLSRYSGQRHPVRSSTRWDGGEDAASGRTYQSVWSKIAKTADLGGVDPVRLIQAVFRYAVGPRPPEPSECANQDSVDKLRGLLRSKKDSLRGELFYNTSMESTETGLILPVGGPRSEEELKAACVKVLLSRRFDFSPIYRVCRAVTLQSRELYSQYFQAARYQFLADTEMYLEVWKEIIPPSFIEDARSYSGGAGGTKS
jgi:hypothetical protein